MPTPSTSAERSPHDRCAMPVPAGRVKAAGAALRLRPVCYVKEVLRWGVWRSGGRPWRVTADVLEHLVHSWRLAQQRGVRIPVVWNHSHDARDQVGEVTDLFVLGGRLFVRFWAVLPDDVRRIGVTVHDASVEVRRPWFDGAGHRYELMLTHVALVNHPVLPGQRSFVSIPCSCQRRSRCPR